MPSRRDQSSLSIFNLISPQGRDPNKNSSTNLFLGKLYQTYRLNWMQGRRERKSKFIPGPWSFRHRNFPSGVPILFAILCRTEQVSPCDLNRIETMYFRLGLFVAHYRLTSTFSRARVIECLRGRKESNFL